MLFITAILYMYNGIVNVDNATAYKYLSISNNISDVITVSEDSKSSNIGLSRGISTESTLIRVETAIAKEKPITINDAIYDAT